MRNLSLLSYTQKVSDRQLRHRPCPHPLSICGTDPHRDPLVDPRCPAERAVALESTGYAGTATASGAVEVVVASALAAEHSDWKSWRRIRNSLTEEGASVAADPPSSPRLQMIAGVTGIRVTETAALPNYYSRVCGEDQTPSGPVVAHWLVEEAHGHEAYGDGGGAEREGADDGGCGDGHALDGLHEMRFPEVTDGPGTNDGANVAHSARLAAGLAAQKAGPKREGKSSRSISVTSHQTWGMPLTGAATGIWNLHQALRNPPPSPPPLHH